MGAFYHSPPASSSADLASEPVNKQRRRANIQYDQQHQAEGHEEWMVFVRAGQPRWLDFRRNVAEQLGGIEFAQVFVRIFLIKIREQRIHFSLAVVEHAALAGL